MSSEFVLIVPPDWIEFPEANDLINTGATPVELPTYWIAQQAWEDVDIFLISAGLLPENKHVTNARIVYTENGYRFWVQF